MAVPPLIEMPVPAVRLDVVRQVEQEIAGVAPPLEAMGDVPDTEVTPDPQPVHPATVIVSPVPMFWIWLPLRFPVWLTVK
jgi:hypothetical protein